MLTVGETAPKLDLPDLQGGQHRLRDALARGPVLVVFWKADCATCHLAFPYLQRLTEAYPSGGWHILAVSQDSVQASSDFARRYGLTFPTLIEDDGWSASCRYDPDATPAAFLIGRDGVIEMTSVGFSKADLNEMSRRIAEHLGEEARVIAEENDGNPPFRPG